MFHGEDKETKDNFRLPIYFPNVAPGSTFYDVGVGVGVTDGVAVGVGVAAERRNEGVGVGVVVGVGVDEYVSSSSGIIASPAIVECDDVVDAPNDDAELTVGVTVAPLITLTVPDVGVGVG